MVAMSLVCALSKKRTVTPCISPSSGAVFDRRVVMKYVQTHGTDPISHEPLKVDQLVDINVSPLQLIPILLKLLREVCSMRCSLEHGSSDQRDNCGDETATKRRRVRLASPCSVDPNPNTDSQVHDDGETTDECASGLLKNASCSSDVQLNNEGANNMIIITDHTAVRQSSRLRQPVRRSSDHVDDVRRSSDHVDDVRRSSDHVDDVRRSSDHVDDVISSIATSAAVMSRLNDVQEGHRSSTSKSRRHFSLRSFEDSINAVVASHTAETEEKKKDKLTREQFEALLPEEFHSKLISFEPDADFPSSFKAVVRARCTDMETCIAWKTAFSSNCRVKFIAGKSNQEMNRKVCFKQYVCGHSSKHKKLKADHRTKGCRTNARLRMYERPTFKGCRASIKLEVKKVTQFTQYRDKYLREENGSLDTVITINWCHNHSIDSEYARSLRVPDSETRRAFDGYFSSGIYGDKAIKHHRAALEEREDFSEEMLSDSRINPLPNTVRHWSKLWRLAHLGPQSIRKHQKRGERKEKEKKSKVIKKKKTKKTSNEALPTSSNDHARLDDITPAGSVVGSEIPRPTSHERWNSAAVDEQSNRPTSLDGQGGISNHHHHINDWTQQGITSASGVNFWSRMQQTHQSHQLVHHPSQNLQEQHHQTWQHGLNDLFAEGRSNSLPLCVTGTSPEEEEGAAESAEHNMARAEAEESPANEEEQSGEEHMSGMSAQDVRDRELDGCSKVIRDRELEACSNVNTEHVEQLSHFHMNNTSGQSVEHLREKPSSVESSTPIEVETVIGSSASQQPILFGQEAECDESLSPVSDGQECAITLQEEELPEDHAADAENEESMQEDELPEEHASDAVDDESSGAVEVEEEGEEEESSGKVEPVSQEARFSCVVCSARFVLEADIASHVRSHDISMYYRRVRRHDGMIVKSEDDVNLEKHEVDQYSSAEEGTCDVSHSELVQEHTDEGASDTHECRMCDRRFGTKRGLDLHVSWIHTGKRRSSEVQMLQSSLQKYAAATVNLPERRRTVKENSGSVEAVKRPPKNVETSSGSVEAVKRPPKNVETSSGSVEAVKRPPKNVETSSGSVEAVKRPPKNVETSSGSVEAVKLPSKNMPGGNSSATRQVGSAASFVCLHCLHTLSFEGKSRHNAYCKMWRHVVSIHGKKTARSNVDFVTGMGAAGNVPDSDRVLKAAALSTSTSASTGRIMCQKCGKRFQTKRARAIHAAHKHGIRKLLPYPNRKGKYVLRTTKNLCTRILSGKGERIADATPKASRVSEAADICGAVFSCLYCVHGYRCTMTKRECAEKYKISFHWHKNAYQMIGYHIRTKHKKPVMQGVSWKLENNGEQANTPSSDIRKRIANTTPKTVSEAATYPDPRIHVFKKAADICGATYSCLYCVYECRCRLTKCECAEKKKRTGQQWHRNAYQMIKTHCL